MSNRIDSLLSGIGELQAVRKALNEQITGDAVASQALQSIESAIYAADQSPACDRIFKAMACAYLNRELLVSSRVFSVSKDNHLTYDYLYSDNARRSMASLICGD